ncbi:hypothetical protein Bca4012_073513 [Brassica carinata]
MKKKMCIKLSANCDRCRRKAMEVAVNAKGVISVAIEGESGDDLVVVGDGIDAACLVDTLRKKACYAMLETLEEVSPVFSLLMMIRWRIHKKRMMQTIPRTSRLMITVQIKLFHLIVA